MFPVLLGERGYKERLKGDIPSYNLGPRFQENRRGKIKGGNYRGIMMVFIFPQNPDEGMLGKLRELADSFRVIPAIYLPVPDGRKLEG